MTRMIDADALIKELEKVYEYHMAEVKNANKHPEKYTSKFIPVTAGRIDGIADAEIVIADAPTIEPFTDNISRSQAIKDISEWATDILHPDRLVKEDAIHILESLPSAEAVEVTRCKECKWYDDKGKECNRSGGLTMYPLHEYDHCSYAERREP